jgi:hypothetical protein
MEALSHKPSPKLQSVVDECVCVFMARSQEDTMCMFGLF